MIIQPTIQGGGSSAPVTGWTVRFIDFDGTILKTEIVEDGEAATAPTEPTHDLLTFDEWNNDFSNVTGDLDVGATYATTDGHTYLFISLTTVTGTSPVIYLNKSTTDVLNIYNDADDTLLGTSSSSGNINITLALGAVGDFVLRIECAAAYTFGNGSSTTQIFKDGNYAYCLTKAFISNYVTAIGNLAFYNCYSLASIPIPSGVTAIGDSAFSGCYSLASITIPSGVTLIGASAFSGCYSLASIPIPSGVTTLGNYAFSGCYSLTSITIPSGVTAIGTYVFYNCYSLASIPIPSGVTAIGNYAFSGCYSLASITIPSGVTAIGTYAFKNCYSLTSLTIPAGVTSIGASTFYGCYSLTSLTIPSGVTAIGANAFQYCYKIVEHIINPTTPPTLANISAYTDINKICKIKVPADSVDDYKGATNWITYADYIVSQ